MLVWKVKGYNFRIFYWKIVIELLVARKHIFEQWKIQYKTKWDLKRYILSISLQFKVSLRGSTWKFDPLFWNVHQNKIFLFAKFLKKSPKKLWISLLKVTDSSKLAMTEYWKSQAKKFCDFCKCWIADNKAVSHSFPHHFSQVFKTISRNFSEHFISRKWSKTSASRGKSTLRN